MCEKWECVIGSFLEEVWGYCLPLLKLNQNIYFAFIKKKLCKLNLYQGISKCDKQLIVRHKMILIIFNYRPNPEWYIPLNFLRKYNLNGLPLDDLGLSARMKKL